MLSSFSSCEKTFALHSLREGRRVDGRSLFEARDVKLTMGASWGSCDACLGSTRIFVSVSCEMQVPKATRPNEGLLFINVDMTTHANPAVEPGRMSPEALELSRILEKCVKDSGCVDLESLCVWAEEQVWAIRVDIRILDASGGGLADCASIAVLASLMHFRRPDASLVDGNSVVVHPLERRDPVPLTLKHMPLLITFALIPSEDEVESAQKVVVDPTRLEEEVAQGYLLIGINQYKEICTMHLSGGAQVNNTHLFHCMDLAAKEAQQRISLIRQALSWDIDSRRNSSSAVDLGFCQSLRLRTSSERLQPAKVLTCIARVEKESAHKDLEEEQGLEGENWNDEEMAATAPGIVGMHPVVKIGEGGASTWVTPDMTVPSKDVKMEVEESREEEEDDESEEEETALLEGSEIGFSSAKRKAKTDDDKTEKNERTWYPQSVW